MFSFDVVSHRSHMGELNPWSRQMRASASDLVRCAAALFTMHKTPLDLLSYVDPSENIAVAIDQMLSIPDPVYRDELRLVLAARSLPPRCAPLIGTDLRSRRRLAEAISEAATRFVLPKQQRIQSFLATTSATATGRARSGDIDRMLTRLHPSIRWQSPWLTISTSDRVPRSYVSDGGGITFVPSALMSDQPILVRQLDHSRPWLVFYSAVNDLADLVRVHMDPNGLDAAARLMGQSRSDLLMTVAERPGRPVKELAARVGISVAAASEHLAVLRHAGLIEGRRDGKSHSHVLTPVGASVLLAGQESTLHSSGDPGSSPRTSTTAG
ncbi:winged helix-turn-helix domain-containing protein [Luedemannella helvata]|uniref:ArsR/SmtB family transcription factor n=1 Tax=Luedemannella helvata TaxID=349315 RepID=UPI0031CDB8DF